MRHRKRPPPASIAVLKQSGSSLRRQSTRLGLSQRRAQLARSLHDTSVPKETYEKLAESIVRGLATDVQNKAQLAQSRLGALLIWP